MFIEVRAGSAQVGKRCEEACRRWLLLLPLLLLLLEEEEKGEV